jgi:hypothetical protein
MSIKGLRFDCKPAALLRLGRTKTGEQLLQGFHTFGSQAAVMQDRKSRGQSNSKMTRMQLNCTVVSYFTID